MQKTKLTSFIAGLITRLWIHKKRTLVIYAFVSLTILMLLVIAEPSLAQDPSGAGTGTIKDVPAAKPGEPTINEVAEVAGHAKISINIMWTLITGFLVMFMQAGFAMVETGFTRAKNAAHTMSMNFMIYPIGMLGYWIFGYALQMGGVGAVSVLGGTPPLNHEFAITLGGHTFGPFGLKGFF